MQAGSAAAAGRQH